MVACGDACLYVHQILGLEEGEAHVIRNTGKVVSEDVIRPLTISQRLPSTREITLIHHTDCGLLTFKDDKLKQRIAVKAGFKPHFALEALSDLGEDVHGFI